MKIHSLTLFPAMIIYSAGANPDNAQNAEQTRLELQQMEMKADGIAQSPDPKHVFVVGENFKGYAFARYVQDWLAKVERVGSVNYPEAARRQEIYGSLMLTVSIYADGRVEKIEIVRSFGSNILDAAAIRIVELAAPYASLYRRHAQEY